MNCILFPTPPDDFNPTMEASGCFCQWEDKVLFLQRHPNKYEGNMWGVPGGKREHSETNRMTVVREIYEEIGLDIDDEGLRALGSMYCRLPNLDYIFHIYCKRFVDFPQLILAPEEHLEAKWVTPKEALDLPLMCGGLEALNFYLQKQ